MNAIMKVKDLSEEETRQVQLDLEKYCALDTYAVVKVIEKLYEVIEKNDGSNWSIEKGYAFYGDTYMNTYIPKLYYKKVYLSNGLKW